MTSKGREQLEKFKELFPNLWNDNQSVSERTPNVLVINPVPGKRGRKYMFVLRADGSWVLEFC